MKVLDLKDFLVNPIKQGEEVIVDANWLQQQLKQHKRTEIEHKATISKLQKQLTDTAFKLSILQTALEIERSRTYCGNPAYKLNIKA